MNNKLTSIYIDGTHKLDINLDLKDNLDLIIYKLADNISNSNLFTQKNGDIIEILNESEKKLEDIIIEDKKLYMITSKPTPNDLKSKLDLTEEEKKLIQSMFDKCFTPEVIFDTLQTNGNKEKEESIKKYYFSLKKPIKPIPLNLKKLIVKTVKDSILPCYLYPSKYYSSKRYFTLLLIGEVGSGKTTLVDAFVNYLAGINYEDPWRYKLIDENYIYNLKPGESYRFDITSYMKYVNYQRDDGDEINIKIIDTPGLGDLRNTEDSRIFERYWKVIKELDYILITVNSHNTRWTMGTQQIYNRIQEIFGKEAKDRFFLVCTFSDCLKPLAIDALKDKFHFQEYFCFNNSALYLRPDINDQFAKFFWKLGMVSMKKLFGIILKNNLPPLKSNI